MKLTGLNRDTTDKFYTKQSAVELCKKEINSYITINREQDIIIEPSAGNGAFIDVIKELSNNYIFYDISPAHPEVIKMDYLNFTDKPKGYNKIHIITNPPFGRQSTMAIKFIKKSCSFCDTLSFILPKSFKKDGMKRHFPLNFHLLKEIDLPKNSFVVDEKECDVPTCFQIWEKRDELRKIPEKKSPKGFVFVKKTDNPDISFRRVGIYAGCVSTDIEEKSVQSHYFIKFSNNVQQSIERVKTCKFEEDNTVGPKSISKQEVIEEFNKVLTKE
jgi:hypothetical protein